MFWHKPKSNVKHASFFLTWTAYFKDCNNNCWGSIFHFSFPMSTPCLGCCKPKLGLVFKFYYLFSQACCCGTKVFFCNMGMWQQFYQNNNLMGEENSGNVPLYKYKLWTLIIPIVRFYLVAWIWKQNGIRLWTCQATIITFRPRSSMNGPFHLQLHIILNKMGPIHFVAIAMGQPTFEKNCKILAIIMGMCTYILL